MRIAPIFSTNKLDKHKEILESGGEGLMIKDIKGHYVQKGRPKSMYKLKRYEEVDAFVTGANPGKKDKGWQLLIGDLEFSAFTETGKRHMVAKCANMPLEERIEASMCAKCGGEQDVSHDNVGGKRVILGTKCKSCGAENPGSVLNPAFLNRVACITGQEWTARVYRLKHAVIERWRTSGEDAKNPQDCTVNLKLVQRRFIRAAQSIDL